MARKRKSKKQHVCIVCDKTFDVTPAQAHEKKKTCSRKCLRKLIIKNNKNENRQKRTHETATFVCETCKTTTITRLHYVNNGRRFCSEQCRLEWFSTITPTGENNPYWRGGGSGYYGENWKDQKEKCRERDENTCQHCGKTNIDCGYNLPVHHITPFKEFGIDNYLKANKLSNLICLCRSCHLKEEWRLKRSNQNKHN